MYQYNEADYKKRIEWFQEARFGLFLHFGVYALPARGEWVRSDEQISIADYQPYFDSFNPTELDAKEWARMAKEAGMQYAVLTAKHHDGFCLFDSKYTDYKVTNTPYGKDIIAEYTAAFREAGLKVGLYYSLLDWHHPDYPHYGDMYHPMRKHPEEGNEGRNFDRYLTYYHNQVRELCSNYGKLDIMWFDFSYGDMRGENWKAAELIDMVRSLQPGILIDNRLEVSGEGFGSLYACEPTPWHGDFVTPEKMIPPEGLQNVRGEDICWESCITMNNNWGYCRRDHLYKPAPFLIRKLVEVVSKGGNMILNVGPTETGAFPEESVAVLREMGQWMQANGERIYGCGKAGFAKPEFGRFTRRDDTLYLHVYENSIGPLPVPQIKKSQVKSAVMLCNQKEIPISTSWVHSDYPDVCFLDLGENPVLPEPTDTVIRVELKK